MTPVTGFGATAGDAINRLWILRLACFVILPALGKEGRTRRDLALELITLRQQLAALRLKTPRHRPGRGFQTFWILLRRCWPRWKEACVLVKPATVIRWHRSGFRWIWRLKSHPSGRKRTHLEVRVLVQRMVSDNPRWGAPRIHGELLKLGFRVSQRTISRLLPKRVPTGDQLERHRQNWRTFLRNHREVLAAMDFLVVPT